ncbi:hypothetical protein QO011_002586 [Labrys wisconsinensis]|uniref:Uncharacterized protein n=1 Tax=Labrys wisconsinensis TaxID=425677 RepID=A0ABU0J5N1_9HYPH|nr:hypothetical protein [Labrys wisconsinensis]
MIANEGESQELGYTEAVEKTIAGIVPIEPSPSGAFAKHVMRSDMLKNLGGENDTNHTLTRRLLLLLEGEWLVNPAEFKLLRREIIKIYVKATRRDHQLALFLLNDIIRYWRTMTVDYMYKTTEDQKPWAIRNIKLTFSRKLLYASGVFSVGMTANRSEEAKVDILENLFDLPVIDRMIDICGASRAKRVLESYDLFLENLEKSKVREELKVIKPGDHENIIFRKLKNEGHHFTRSLMNLFEETFHSTHPIRRAMMF